MHAHYILSGDGKFIGIEHAWTGKERVIFDKVC